jgi:adenine-specific DNA-methyltransferase
VPAHEQILRFKTLAGLARAFRQWTRTCSPTFAPEVDGATAEERRALGALGAIAATVGDEHIASWPEPVRLWAERAPKCPAEIADGVREALGTELDPLTLLYEASISRAHRRRLGTVFTPAPVVNHMLDLVGRVASDDPDCVADPGAGVGAFTIAAARRWPNARIVAVDVNIVTLGLLATRIAFEIDAEPADADVLRRIELDHADYLDGLSARFGAGKGRLLALGNPPYTRMQELPPNYRAKAMELCDDVVDSGHANLAVLFQAATLRHMREQDASCMVLPGSIGYTRASRGLRQALWDSERPIAIQRTPATTRPFTGNSVQATIVAVGPNGAERSPVQMARVRFDGDAAVVIEEWERERENEEPTNWFRLQRSEGDDDSVPLSELAVVRRGVATGANAVFFLNDKEAARLPQEVVTPGALTLKRFARKELNRAIHRTWGGAPAKRWLLAIPEGFEVEGELSAYLDQFEADVRARFLPSQRQPWYVLTNLIRPDLLIGPLSSNGFTVVVNTVRAVPSNNLYGITMRNGTRARALADWLRSDEGQQALVRVSRRYHGGSHKLEPGELKRVAVPAALAKPNLDQSRALGKLRSNARVSPHKARL